MKISVVTVCYNAVQTLEKTMLSVLNQTYPDVEYIIIDGGSTDGTVDIIKKYADRLAYWVSEPDKGIYDAMNKGIKVATGEWICFLNSGDSFYERAILEKVFKDVDINNDFVDVIYGDMILNYSFVDLISYPLSLSMFNQTFPFSHPSSFVKLVYMKSMYFDTQYKFAADYDFFLKLYCEKKKFAYKNMIISIFEAEKGASSKNKIRTWKEVMRINGNNRSVHYYPILAILIIKMQISKILSFFAPQLYNKIFLNRILRRTNIQLMK